MSELTTRSAFPLPLLNEFGLVVPKTWLIANKSPEITHFAFLPDPGVSGVRSMGPGVHTSVQELCETLLM